MPGEGLILLDLVRFNLVVAAKKKVGCKTRPPLVRGNSKE
jgi:hypothetical protein